jgi:hypothetical protein
MPDIRQYAFHGGTLASTFALPELRPASGGHPVCSVDRAADGPDGPCDWFHTWRLDGRTCLAFGRRADGYLLRVPRMADFVVSANGRRVRCHARRSLPGATFRHLLLDQVLPLALSRLGRLVLHASAVHVPGLGAIAFVGRAGRGKSTIAAALAADGCPLVTDDCLVVHPGAGNAPPLVFPAYPGVRLWQDAAEALGVRRSAGAAVAHYTSKRRVRHDGLASRTRASPLRAVFILTGRYRAGPPCRAGVLGARDRFMAVMRYLYLLDVADSRQLTRAFLDVASLVDRVPILKLQVVDDRHRLDELARSIRMLHPRSAAVAVP